MTGTGYDPRKARGFIDVQALHMYATEKMRHQQLASSRARRDHVHGQYACYTVTTFKPEIPA
jgi:hypothetical protein